MPGIIKRLFGGVDDARDELTRLRADIEATKANIAAEQARPVPLAEVEARLDATITGLRAQAQRLVHASNLVRAEGGPLAAVLANAQVPGFVLAAVVAPGPLTSWLREQALATAERMGAPVDAETRAKRLAELRGKLADLERREAELMWSADEKGLELPWRPDMNPAAVLGLDAA
jgi:hypothetical protein